MRIVRNGRFGKFRSVPTPLEVCPGRIIWEKHRELEYLVFVDDSFYKFFDGFEDVDGNFCHAALGVPKDSYAHLHTSIRPLMNAYEHQIGLITGEQPRELKSTLLARLPLEFRASFTKELVRSLVAAGGASWRASTQPRAGW
jgi:hypothetical protein